LAKSFEKSVHASSAPTGSPVQTTPLGSPYGSSPNGPWNAVHRLSFSKAAAKVLLFFQLTKYFAKKMHPKGKKSAFLSFFLAQFRKKQ